jgi:hypothetical protein
MELTTLVYVGHLDIKNILVLIVWMHNHVFLDKMHRVLQSQQGNTLANQGQSLKLAGVMPCSIGMKKRQPCSLASMVIKILGSIFCKSTWAGIAHNCRIVYLLKILRFNM